MVSGTKQERKRRRLHALWDKKQRQAKTLWVIAVLAFWVTVAVFGVVYFLEGRVDLLLISIALGLMILGVWLKARYQLIVRSEPERPSASHDPADDP